jgi:integrase
MTKLKSRPGVGARALEFAILTATRSGEVCGMTWDEVDFESATWTIPSTRMKAGKEHRIPLSRAALKVLLAMASRRESAVVFPGLRGRVLSDSSLMEILRRMEVAVTAHGFRSSFRDWAAEATTHPAELAEMALAHAVSNAVEAAYRRGDMFEKRRRLMTDWADYCAGNARAATM